MDKNTLIGLLLMGLVVFGFTMLNQPTPEQIAESKRQTENVTAQNAQERPVYIDSISSADIDMLRRTIQAYGTSEGSANDAVYTLSNDKVALTMQNGAIKGTLALPDTVVAIESIINGTIQADLYSAASSSLKEAIATIGKYRDFAPFVSGRDSIVTLENKEIRVQFSTKGGVISQVDLKNYDAYDTSSKQKVPELTMFKEATNSYSFILNSTDQRFDTKDFYFTPTLLNDSTLLMSLDFGKDVSWGIKYTLSGDDYLVKMEVVQSHMDQVIPQSVAEMGFAWHQKMSRHEQGRMFEERNSAIYYKYAGGDVDYLSETESKTERVTDKIKWIGYKDQFFSTVLIADKYFLNGDFKSAVFEKGSVENADYLKDMNTAASLEYTASNPNPASFNFYFGPNKYKLLASYDDKISPDEDLKLTHLIPLGWSFFRWINTIIIIPIFNFLGNWISNYGIIILLMTLIIKLVLFPLTYKSMKSQAKMRILAPDIKAINDKYPGQENAMVRQQKTMELYNRAGASPFGGCLPMILTMPILFAMFTFFPSCIELRGESFLWVKDLSAPDAIITWNAQIPFITNYFGNHLSLFCLLMTGTNILYTYLNMQSQGSSNQMPGMKIMMYAMPIMFLVFFNNYAAGLSYYYFLSLLITIITTYIFRLTVKEEDVRATMAANAKKPKKKSGFMARLEEMQRQQQAALREQQKRNNRK